MPALLFANFQDGIVEGVTKLVSRHGGEGFACLVDGLIEEAPLDGVFDEL